MAKALICGVSGQDGSLLAKLLLDKGYAVTGATRALDPARFANLDRLAIKDRVALRAVNVMDLSDVIRTLDEERPDEIYNLSGQSSVGLSFEQPLETFQSIVGGALNLLEAVRLAGHPVRIFHAASGECFGETPSEFPAAETTPFRPKSPYAAAKASAYWQCAAYRDAFGLAVCSGLLFNHESHLRSDRFVSRKIVRAASRIAAGSGERLTVGDVSVVRDWGWAPEYVEAMWTTLQRERPADYVIATGESHSLAHFISACFEAVGLDWRDHTQVDPGLVRAGDIARSHADPSRARDELGWEATVRMKRLAEILVVDERGREAERFAEAATPSA